MLVVETGSTDLDWHLNPFWQRNPHGVHKNAHVAIHGDVMRHEEGDFFAELLHTCIVEILWQWSSVVDEVVGCIVGRCRCRAESFWLLSSLHCHALLVCQTSCFERDVVVCVLLKLGIEFGAAER